MRREFPGASVVVWDCGLFAEEPEVDDHEGAMRDLASYGQLRLGGESIVATLAAIEARGDLTVTGDTDAPWSPDPDAEAGMRARFGENVRLLRAHAHVSQEELASRADVHRTQISMFESGQRTPLLGTAIKLAAALEVGLPTLLDGIAYRPRFFSAARGEFEISPRPLFELARREDRSERGA